MAKIEKSVDVNVPVKTVYNQWTQFEEFPRFMEGVKEVRQLDDKRLYWRAEIGGKEKEWNAEISDQVPDQRIAWHSTTGAQNAGRVSFQNMGGEKTRVTLQMDYDPEGVVEGVGDMLGVVSSRVQGDLERFKEYIETRGSESGAWRGEIHGSQTRTGGTGATSSTSSKTTATSGTTSTGGTTAGGMGTTGGTGTTGTRGTTGTIGGGTSTGREPGSFGGSSGSTGSAGTDPSREKGNRGTGR